jgi:subtilisin family serine protease
LVLALVLLGTAVAVAGSATSPRKLTAKALTPDSTFTSAKSASGTLAKTDPSLLGRESSNPINVLIKYDYDPTASYAGGVSGLAPTSPAATGESLKENRSAVNAYEQHTAAVSSKISTAVTKAVPDARIRRAFQTAYGGVAATVPANSVAELLKVDGVVAVQEDKLEQPQTSVTPEFTGASDVWPSLGGSVHAGENVTVGIFDTGIWPEHPSFANQGLPAPNGGPYGCEFGDGTDVAHLGPTFSCNRKLVGAYAFLDTYLLVLNAVPGEFCNNATGICSARDANGHGTHTSSTAAGGPVASTQIFGINRGAISGMAPGARVIMYRVCLEQGCFQSDSINAVEQAIEDEIDVINFSIGGGANPYTDAVEIAFLAAFDAGISVNASAGNAGPGAGTADHGGPWVTTVGASTSPRWFQSTLRLSGSGGTLNLVGSTITPGIASAPVILATAAGGDALCLNPLNPALAAGKIVVCQRGPGRVAKGKVVDDAGGAGMILYNPTKMDVMSDNHWLPAIHIDQPASGQLLAFLAANTGETASWATGAPTARPADVMTNFSSRGPVGDFLKPDVTAPGIQILAGHTPEPTPAAVASGPPGEDFQAIAGTSMSSPHSAGASAVVKAAHPDWTPAMIKSALMTSAETEVLKDDGVTPADPFDDGAGSIRVNRAVNPTLVFDETTADFIAKAGDPLHRVDLNLASVNATTMTGQITTKRTAINVSGREQTLKVDVSAPAGVTIYVSDKEPDPSSPKADNSIHLKRNGTTDFWITISAPEVANGQYFGRITLDPNREDATEVTMPVAFVKRQGAVTLTHECSPTTFPKKTGFARCNATVTNFASVPADVELTVTNLDKGKLDFTHIVAPATAIKKNNGVQWNGTLTPALAPTIDSITQNNPIDLGYIPLAFYGIAPIAGVTDETIVNVPVPFTFYYGEEAYTRIGVVSNGYVVIGGGQGPDIVFTPTSLPNPARPNNIVAPVWTDLNPAFGGAIRVGILTNTLTATNYLIVDYAAVRNYTGPTTHTFNVRIRLSGGGAGVGPDSEEVTIAYGPGDPFFGATGNGNAGQGDPDAGVNWGAENRDGSSGKNIASAPPNGSEYSVNTSGATAGGRATITYDAESKQAGIYKSLASMISNVTPGLTQVVQTLTVTN